MLTRQVRYNNTMALTIIIPLLLGWLAGYLVNYLADVLPLTRRFTRPECPQCHTPYQGSDYLLFRKCRNCGKKPSLRRLILQASLVLLTALAWLVPNPHLPFILAFILLIYLATVLIIDLEHRVILHPVSLVGAGLGLITGIFLNSSGTSLTAGIITTLLGGVCGFGVMLVFYFLGELYVRYMARKRQLPADEVALGFGDVNLSGILGMMLGWPTILAGLFFAILAGGLVSLVLVVRMLIAKNYKNFTAIPYAPFLVISAFLIIFL
jgi:leader peptidase (prepilin peptidase) / N-methyltransferase